MGSFQQLPSDHQHAREMLIVGNYAGDPNHLNKFATTDQEKLAANALLFVTPSAGVDQGAIYLAAKPDSFWDTGKIAESGLTLWPRDYALNEQITVRNVDVFNTASSFDNCPSLFATITARIGQGAVYPNPANNLTSIYYQYLDANIEGRELIGGTASGFSGFYVKQSGQSHKYDISEGETVTFAGEGSNTIKVTEGSSSKETIVTISGGRPSYTNKGGERVDSNIIAEGSYQAIPMMRASDDNYIFAYITVYPALYSLLQS